MEQSDEMDDPEIHAILSERNADLYGLIRQQPETNKRIDAHVETCATCRERLVGWSRHLPKLRARVTVEFPPTEYKDLEKRLAQLRQLQRGQCLPCGCEVWEIAWTHEYATEVFYKQLATVLEVPEEFARHIPVTAQLRSLPLSVVALRRLRDAFWIPDNSFALPELRDAEEGEEVRQLPETIQEFITRAMSLHPDVRYSECDEHDTWCPG